MNSTRRRRRRKRNLPPVPDLRRCRAQLLNSIISRKHVYSFFLPTSLYPSTIRRQSHTPIALTSHSALLSNPLVAFPISTTRRASGDSAAADRYPPSLHHPPWSPPGLFHHPQSRRDNCARPDHPTPPSRPARNIQTHLPPFPEFSQTARLMLPWD